MDDTIAWEGTMVMCSRALDLALYFYGHYRDYPKPENLESMAQYLDQAMECNRRLQGMTSPYAFKLEDDK